MIFLAKMVTYITDARYQPDYGKCRVEAFGDNPLPAHTLGSTWIDNGRMASLSTDYKARSAGDLINITPHR